MATTVKNLKFNDVDYESVTFKLFRAFGSKAEGWNGLFFFVNTGDEFIKENYKDSITLGVVWDEEANPYKLLYQRLHEFLVERGFSPEEYNPAATISSAPDEPAIETVQEPAPIKKPRKKKEVS